MEVEEVRKIFEKNNQKFTKQREIIFETLKNSSSKHQTAEEVFSEVHQVNKQVGIATVYRALNLFEELGIVNKQEFTDSIATYELVDPEGCHHDHLICTNCGKIVEEEIISKDELTELLKDKYDFNLDYYSLRIYGICSDCKKTQE